MKEDVTSKDYENFISSFNKKLKEGGLNRSYHRECVIKALYFSKNALKASDILRILKKEYKMHIGIATVYRTLLFLSEHNLVCSVTFKNETLYCICDGDADAGTLICKQCGKIKKFSNCKFDDIRFDSLRNHDFSIDQNDLVFKGLCKKCSLKIPQK